jgi:glycosyltransferase involved in cell wall biosynthesis
VRFLGFVSNEAKYQYLSVSDLFVLASLHEGFGVVYLEAMFCGLPIIAADRGGQTDILEDGVTGSLVPSGDQDRMDQAIRHWLDDPATAKRTGESNRARADNYTVARVAERYERAFEGVAGESAADSVNEPI